MRFEWNNNKALANLRKHKVSFEEAKSVFDDPLSLTIHDESHSYDEKRYITIGESRTGHVILVCHTIGKENVRISKCEKADAE